MRPPRPRSLLPPKSKSRWCWMNLEIIHVFIHSIWPVVTTTTTTTTTTVDQTTVTTSTSGPGSCPIGDWESYGDVCYLIRPDEWLDWSSAMGKCVDEGGDSAALASIPSQDHNDYIQVRLQEISSAPVVREAWIGMVTQPNGEASKWLNDEQNVTGFALLSQQNVTGPVLCFA